MNDNGAQTQEVKVTGGIGSFAYASIIWVLGVGALTWLGVATGIVEFHHHLTVAERMDNRVGVREPLKNPVKVLIKARQGCFSVKRTYADGNTITLYLHNACPDELAYSEWGWIAKAPDQTVVAQKFSNSLDRVEIGSNIEKTMELPDDDRVATIVVWASTR